MARAQPPRRTRDASALAGLSDDELDRRIAAAEAKFEELLPPSERYERRERSPGEEERVRPFLDRQFKVQKGAVRPYELECHGSVCKLEVPETKPPFEDWQDAIQDDVPGAGMFKGKEFLPDAVYLDLADPLNASGQEASRALAWRFFLPAVVARCKEANPTPSGTADFVVSLDRQTGRFRVEVSGPLAGEACGRCVLAALQNAIAEIPAAPPGSYVEDEGFRVSVP